MKSVIRVPLKPSDSGSWWGLVAPPINDSRLFCREEFDPLFGTHNARQCVLRLAAGPRQGYSSLEIVDAPGGGFRQTWHYRCRITTGSSSGEFTILNSSMQALIPSTLGPEFLKTGTKFYFRITGVK